MEFDLDCATCGSSSLSHSVLFDYCSILEGVKQRGTKPLSNLADDAALAD